MIGLAYTGNRCSGLFANPADKWNHSFILSQGLQISETKGYNVAIGI